MSYQLLDGEKINGENPDTYFIPMLEDRQNLNVQDYAQVTFNGDLPERMWIKINKIIENGYQGILDNNPIGLKNVKYGDMIIFNYSNIIKILRSNEL